MKIDREQVRRRMLRQEIQTFTELADKMGISKQALSQWFKGGPFASTNLAALCKILQCTPNDILILDDAPNVMAPALMAVS
jgi:DNA-binding Xre family transcriptional regulator